MQRVCGLLLAGALCGPFCGLPATAAPAVAPLTTTARPDDAATPAWNAFTLLGQSVAPRTRANLRWVAGQSFSGSPLRAPVVVLRGKSAGPTLCLTAAVHGDELNGVEVVRRIMAGVEPDTLRGTLVGVPIVNLLGFSEGSRYLPDRSDLNRYFPGHPRGNSAERIAHSFFDEVVLHCDRLVDLHTGSFKRSNLPQLRANLDLPPVAEFVRHFGGIVVLHIARERGTLRDAATRAGIPAATLELGEPGFVQTDHVRYGVKAIRSLLGNLDMLDEHPVWARPMRIFRRSRWLRAHHGGILNARVELGQQVAEGELLGRIINPVTNEEAEIRAPFAGQVLGRALDQFVLPGYATFHLGRDTETDAAAGDVLEAESTPADDEEPPSGGTIDFERGEPGQRQEAKSRKAP